MSPYDLDEMWEGPPDSEPDTETRLDFDADGIVPQDEPSAEDSEATGENDEGEGTVAWRAAVENAALDDVLVDFVDLFNARDWEGMTDLLAADVESGFFGNVTRADLIDALNDLILRYASLVVTRGDIGAQPVAAAWLLDQGTNGYDPVGYFTIALADGDDPRIGTVDYVEEVPDDEDVVLEVPDSGERNEWEDWSMEQGD